MQSPFHWWPGALGFRLVSDWLVVGGRMAGGWWVVAWMVLDGWWCSLV